MRETTESEGFKVTIPSEEFDELTELVQKLGYESLADYNKKEGPISDTEEIHGEDGSLTFKIHFKPGTREMLLQRLAEKQAPEYVK